MNKILVVILVLSVGLISCKASKTEIDQLRIAKHYYKALNTSDDFEIITLFNDSITVIESDDKYEEHFSKESYIKWLQWDAVFKPTYKILQIEEKKDLIKVKVSKIDKRLIFLHEAPIIWYETMRFRNHKIHSVERSYEVFNVSNFIKNRDSLIRWIDSNHPELNGFLDIQTEASALKYLKAIELYQKEAL